MTKASLAFLLVTLLILFRWAWAEESNSVRLYGLNFSPNFGDWKRDAQADEAAPSDELEQWLRVVAGHTRWIRTFDCSGRLANVGEIAHRMQLKAAVNAWLGPERNDEERAANESAVAQLIGLGRQNQIDLAIVGSEVLFRGDLTPDQLLGYILQVKQALPDIPVTTADTSGQMLDHPEIIDAVDVLFINHYSYWEGISVEQAVPALHGAYQELSNASRGKPVIVSESGWPTCGETRGEAVASPENAQYFLTEFMTWAEANQVRYFYFEAFDEPWKADFEGPQGACWGIWDRNGRLKPVMNLVFNISPGAPSASAVQEP